MIQRHCWSWPCWIFSAVGFLQLWHGLWSTGSVAVVHNNEGLSGPSACGIFLAQGSNPCSLIFIPHGEWSTPIMFWVVELWEELEQEQSQGVYLNLESLFKKF